MNLSARVRRKDLMFMEGCSYRTAQRHYIEYLQLMKDCGRVKPYRIYLVFADLLDLGFDIGQNKT